MTNQEPQGEQPATAGEWRGCPCLYTEPCNPRCTCVSGWSSRGCSRCASYGSLKQRQSKARSLAADHNAASRLRIAEDALDAAAALGAFVGDIRESNDCGYFNSEDHSEPGETMYLALRRTLAAFMGVDDDEAVWDENYDARHRPQGKQP